MDEASEGETNIAEYLDALATERSRADVATELAGRDLFWRWNARQTAWEMNDVLRKQFCRFCVAVFHRSGAALNDPLGRVLMHPDVASVRGWSVGFNDIADATTFEADVDKTRARRGNVPILRPLWNRPSSMKPCTAAAVMG